MISRCLGFQACRWDGQIIQVPWVESLKNKAELITVCPETDIGLGIPRHPINLHQINDIIQVIQENTENNLTERLTGYCKKFLENIENVDVFILKSESPSCGYLTTKIHCEDSVELGSGVFASLVREMFPDVVFLDETMVDRVRELFGL